MRVSKCVGEIGVFDVPTTSVGEQYKQGLWKLVVWGGKWKPAGENA
jgi:hypothetical protein